MVECVRGVIFNIQRYSIHDGPGIRSTVFMKGCPLTCLWCDNPESQSYKPEIAHRNAKCNKCERCLKVCKQNAIALVEDGVTIDRSLCNMCGDCLEICYPGAIEIIGRKVSVEEVIQEVEKDIRFYINSDGGVTVSGGGPGRQADFVAKLFEELHGINIHTTMDTSGYVQSDKFE